MGRFRIATAAALLLAGGVGPAAQSAAPARTDQAYTSTATAILVDVVVRDRKGRPVIDLAAADFDVTEDGVAQSVDTFTRVSRGGGIGIDVGWKSSLTTVGIARAPDAGGEAVPDEQEQEESVTALVFDQLSPESLRLAQRATLDYVPMAGESKVRVAVFATNPGVRVLQGYTSDRTRVRQAVQRVLPSGTSLEEKRVERTGDLMAQRRSLRSANDEAGSGNIRGADLAGNAAEVGEREMMLRMVQTELNMIRSFEALDRDHRGYDTSLGLIAVIRSLSQFAGRKTIVFFSEGLPVSPSLSAKLDHVIDTANRANVTAYAVDAQGLRANSTTDTMRKEVEAFAEERFVQNATGVGRTEQPLTLAFERVEDTLRLDSRTGLARLAKDTGGFLIEGSNDLSGAFRRIDEDNQFHYLLTYSPKNTAFDGKFRAIQVKVRRPDTQVFARKGYRAIPAPAGLDSGSLEAPALALLDRAPLPNAFPVHGAGFSFPDPSRPGLTPVLVQVRTDKLRFTVDEQRATYAGQAAIVVRIRDAGGQAIEKLSQEYLLTGDARDVEAAKNGEILFYREVDLAPGLYTLESIVFDGGSGRASARVATLTVPAQERSALGMSSLILVSRTEEVADAPAPGAQAIAPLYVGRTLLYPNLGEPIRRTSTSELPFYFALYGNVQGVEAHAQLLRNGEALAEAPVPLAAANGGRLQHVGRLPIGGLPAGTYELRIRVGSGAQELSRAAFFTLQE